MAKLFLFSVFDNKAAFYNPIMTFRSIGEAVRDFGDAVNNPQTSINRYPEDFTLFQLGEFDDQVAVVNMLQAPLAVATASSLVRVQKSVDSSGSKPDPQNIAKLDAAMSAFANQG